jgi:hypothetical protein
VKTKLPRTHKELSLMLSAEYSRGWSAANASTATAKALDQKRSESERAKIHLEALREATRIISIAGQAAGELVRGMASEKGQL